MDFHKSVRYVGNTRYLTEGFFGAVFINEDSTILVRFEPILEKDLSSSTKNKYNTPPLVIYKFYSLVLRYTPRLYDVATLKGPKLRTNKVFSAKKALIKKYLHTDLCYAMAFDYVHSLQYDWVDVDTNSSLFLQLLWAVHNLNSLGYTHGDLHAGNILICKTDEQFVNCGGYMIPTRGLQPMLIDFGNVRLKRNELDDYHSLISLMISSRFFKIFVNGQKIKLKNMADIAKSLPGDGFPSMVLKYHWNFVNNPTETQKLDFGKKYVETLEVQTFIKTEHLSQLCYCDSPWSAFEKYCSLLNIEKTSDPEPRLEDGLIHNDGWIDGQLLNYSKLRSISPMSFAPILRYYQDGWIFELPPYTLSEKLPTIESVNQFISTLDQFDCSIMDCTEDNFRVDENGWLVGYGFKDIVQQNKKCTARKILQRFRQPSGL